MEYSAIVLTAASLQDADSLADLRVTAMRESLTRIGRFDPQRARDRILSDFNPEHTRIIEFNQTRVGFIVTKPNETELLLDQLHILPDYPGQGLGTFVLRLLFAEADESGLSIRVGALKESGSNKWL